MAPATSRPTYKGFGSLMMCRLSRTKSRPILRAAALPLRREAPGGGIMRRGKRAPAATIGQWAATAALIGVAVGGCRGSGSTPADEAPTAAPPAVTTPRYGTFGVDLGARKTSVKPGDDFFANVNGHWLDTVHDPGRQELVRRRQHPRRRGARQRAEDHRGRRGRQAGAGIGRAEDRRLLRVVHGHRAGSRPPASTRSSPISIASPP